MKVLGVFRKSMLGFFFQVCAKGHSVWRKRPFNPQLCGRYFGRILSFSRTCSLSFCFESWHWWSNWWQAYNWVWSLKQGSSTLKSFWYIWAEKTETKDGYYINRKKRESIMRYQHVPAVHPSLTVWFVRVDTRCDKGDGWVGDKVRRSTQWQDGLVSAVP